MSKVRQTFTSVMNGLGGTPADFQIQAILVLAEQVERLADLFEAKARAEAEQDIGGGLRGLVQETTP